MYVCIKFRSIATPPPHPLSCPTKETFLVSPLHETPLFDGVVQEHCETRVSHDQVNKLAKMKP